MSNELLFILLSVFNLALAVGAAKLGRGWLELYIYLAMPILIAVLVHPVEIFGFTTMPGVSLFAGIFLVTDILTERYGKAAGYAVIRKSAVMIVLFNVFAQIGLALEPALFGAEVYAAMQVMFELSLRLTLAGLISYVVWQHFDVWFYHFIDKLTQGKHLWLRNNGSTILSQTGDTFTFFLIGLYGVVPNVWEMALTAVVIKWIVALCDTPFIYWAKKLKPLDLKK